MVKGERAGGEEVELDADGELAAAIAALKEAAWRLRMASYNLEEEHAGLSPSVYRPMELGACVALADVLATQVEACASQARKLRKRAREI